MQLAVPSRSRLWFLQGLPGAKQRCAELERWSRGLEDVVRVLREELRAAGALKDTAAEEAKTPQSSRGGSADVVELSAKMDATLRELGAKVEEVASRQGELSQMDEIVGQTYSSLETERQKALLLVRNFAPALADQLDAEFADAT